MASPHGGPVDYIVQGKNGRVFGLNEPIKWEKAIRAVFFKVPMRPSLEKYRQAEVRALLALQKTASEFLKVYGEILA